MELKYKIILVITVFIAILFIILFNINSQPQEANDIYIEPVKKVEMFTPQQTQTKTYTYLSNLSTNSEESFNFIFSALVPLFLCLVGLAPIILLMKMLIKFND